MKPDCARNHRRKLKQRYKDTPRAMGVYEILNHEDGISLLGTSKDVQARLNRHRAELGFGGHRDEALQSDWNRLGEGKFVFRIVELLSPLDDPGNDPAEDLEELLQMILESEEYADRSLYDGRKRADA